MLPQERDLMEVITPFTRIMRRKLIKKILLKLYAIFLFFFTKISALSGNFPVLFFHRSKTSAKYVGKQLHLAGPATPVACAGGHLLFFSRGPRHMDTRTHIASSHAGAAATSSRLLGMGPNANDRLQILQSVCKALHRNSVHGFSTTGGEFRIFKISLIYLIVLKLI